MTSPLNTMKIVLSIVIILFAVSFTEEHVVKRDHVDTLESEEGILNDLDTEEVTEREDIPKLEKELDDIIKKEVPCDETPFRCCMDEKTAAKSFTDYCKRSIEEKRTVPCYDTPFKCCRDEITAAKSFTDYCKRSIEEKRTDLDDDGIAAEELITEDESYDGVPLMDVPRDGGSCLTTHNKLRALHRNTPALQWDASLAAQAQEWADKLLKMFKMKHSTNKQRPGQGENLAYGAKWPANVAPRTCDNAIRAWYNEINNYDWSNPGHCKPTNIRRKKVIGHFTQVVWKDATKLGMGIASGKTTRKGRVWKYTYIVARYSPPGNWRGQYGDNVMPLKNGGGSAGPKPVAPVVAPTGGCEEIDTFKYCKHYKNLICQTTKYPSYRKRCKKTCNCKI